MSVAKQYEKSNIWDDFKSVTHDVELSLDQLDFPAFKAHIKRNHALLDHIGVVPTSISTLISELEAVGAAAKICGAGSISGEAAGMVLIATEDNESIIPICENYGFTCVPVEMNTTGAHVL
jgi:mevalonate kinase